MPCKVLECLSEKVLREHAANRGYLIDDSKRIWSEFKGSLTCKVNLNYRHYVIVAYFHVEFTERTIVRCWFG